MRTAGANRTRGQVPRAPARARHPTARGHWGFVTALLLAACGPAPLTLPLPKVAPPPPPTRLALDLRAAPRMNPGPDGLGTPMLVRIYELAADGRFMEADFFRLSDNDASVLGSDLVARDQSHLSPGETRQFDKTLNPATRTLGVMAAYRVTDGVRWRATVPVIPNTVNHLQLDLGPRELTLSPRP